MNDTITITDLEVRARVGGPDEERATPQRLLLTVELEQPFAEATAGDAIEATIERKFPLMFGQGFSCRIT